MSATRVIKSAIKIPKRIERGPTDILKALASTVKYSPTEPESNLQDDPYLLPVTPNNKVIFNLSKLNGKMTARFFLNKYPELFFRDDSEPKINAFLPPEEFRADMEFTEDDIKWCIENMDSVNAIIAYNSMKEKGVKLSDEVLLQFFEMICYTNEDRILSLIEIQKKYFIRSSDQHLINQTWNTSSLAHKIFNEIKEDLDPSRVYGAMIAGLSKFNQHETARQVFEEFKETHLDKPLSVEAYDGLLRSVPRLNSSSTTAHDAVDNIVKHMESHLVMPNLLIFNSILDCYRLFNCDNSTAEKALKLINDLRELGIEPSFASYSSLFRILFKSRYRNRIEIFNATLDYILSNGDRSLEVRDQRDVNFLLISIRIFADGLHNMDLTNKLHKIYMRRPNLFSSNHFKSIYLDSHFMLMITTDSIRNTLDFYEAHVPSQFRPSVESYDALAEALELYQVEPDTVKKIGGDTIRYKVADKLKNTTIFRKDPQFEKACDELISQ